MLSTLSLLSTSMAISIILSSNPATLSLWVILMALMITCAMGLNLSNWFGLIIFLIYIGGMLVMFSYFVMIQPNQQLNVKSQFLLTLLTTLILALTSSLMFKPLINITMMSPLKPYLLLLSNNLIILFIMALTLFLALVAVVKISKINYGPLRPFSINM